MMKVPQGGNLGGASNMYDLWTSNFTIAADTENALDVHPGTTYKSRDVLDWDNFNISLVITVKILKIVTVMFLSFRTDRSEQTV